MAPEAAEQRGAENRRVGGLQRAGTPLHMWEAVPRTLLCSLALTGQSPAG